MIKSTYLSLLVAPLAITAALALPAGLALAAASNGDYVGKTMAEITKALEQQGYKISEIEREGRNIEADVVLDGKEYEIVTDRRTGQIVEILEEGEDGDDDENEGSFIKRLLRIGGDDD